MLPYVTGYDPKHPFQSSNRMSCNFFQVTTISENPLLAVAGHPIARVVVTRPSKCAWSRNPPLSVAIEENIVSVNRHAPEEAILV